MEKNIKKIEIGGEEYVLIPVRDFLTMMEEGNESEESEEKEEIEESEEEEEIEEPVEIPKIIRAKPKKKVVIKEKVEEKKAEIKIQKKQSYSKQSEMMRTVPVIMKKYGVCRKDAFAIYSGKIKAPEISETTQKPKEIIEEKREVGKPKAETKLPAEKSARLSKLREWLK